MTARRTTTAAVKNAAAAPTPDITTMLGRAKLPETVVPTCLAGDLMAEWEQLERDLEQARAKQSDSLAGNGEGPILDRMESLRGQMQETTYPVRLRALPWREWRALCAEHPPRKTDEGTVDDRDVMLQINAETFFPALTRRSIVKPEMDDDTYERFVDALTERQYGKLGGEAWSLNRSDVDVPFLPAGSRTPRDSGTA